MRVSASEWAARVRAWNASGRTVEAFCEDKDYTPKTLRWWASKLVRRERTGRAVRSVALARVVRPGEELRDASQGPTISVLVGRYQVAVRGGFDAELLRGVVRVLAELQ